MPKLVTFLLIVLYYSCASTGDKTENRYNLDLERPGPVSLPEGWEKVGQGAAVVDSVAVSGQSSIRLNGTGLAGEFTGAEFLVPALYSGSTISVTGSLRLEAVTDGFAGLFLRVSGPGGKNLGFEQMQDEGLRGTRDWQAYAISMDYPEGAKEIYVGAMLAGPGTVWLDDFTVRIDDVDIESLEPAPTVSYAADRDHSFDGGSGITFPELTSQTVADLELLGRIWGFVKYHHPAIGRGEKQWDYELFRFLPDYLAAETHAQRETLLERWINGLGEVPACADCIDIPKEQRARTAGKDWIDRLIDSASLRQRLHFIHANRSTGNHYYISAGKVDNPVFLHEQPYDSTGYPDAGFRLLALYRYWNMIRYYFPYVGETDRDWEEILYAYIPDFIGASDELAYEYAALELIGETGDTHANLWAGGDRIDADRGGRYAPVTLRFAQGGQLVVTDTLATGTDQPANLAIGDVITHIDGKAVEELVAERRARYPASNDAARWRDMAPDLLRGDEEAVTVVVRTATGNESRQVPLLRIPSQRARRGSGTRARSVYKFLTEEIGYVTLEHIGAEDVPLIRDTFRNTRGLIVDVRNYPATFVPFTLGSYLMPVRTPFVRFTRPVYVSPGTYDWSEPLEIPAADQPYTGRVIVLVNEWTQSQAEYTTMAFRAGPRTTVIGSTTAGADGNVSTICLPGGLRTMISGIGVFYPNKQPTQRIGIVPDIEVPLTVAGVRAGRDEVLERAVSLLQSQ